MTRFFVTLLRVQLSGLGLNVCICSITGTIHKLAVNYGLHPREAHRMRNSEAVRKLESLEVRGIK